MSQCVVALAIEGGTLTITEEDVTIENDQKQEVLYYHASEWNDTLVGDPESAVACMNVIMAALRGGVPLLFEICPNLKDNPDLQTEPDEAEPYTLWDAFEAGRHAPGGDDSIMP